MKTKSILGFIFIAILFIGCGEESKSKANTTPDTKVHSSTLSDGTELEPIPQIPNDK